MASWARWRGRTTAPPPAEPHGELTHLSLVDRIELTKAYDDSVALPDGAAETLVADNPRLLDLRRTYEGFEHPVRTLSQWTDPKVSGFLDLGHFRGESLITWHYRELPRITRLKFFVLARYVSDHDELGLLSRLHEDGAFGCWSYDYPGYGRFSRDLLQSVNEISFMERELGLSGRADLRVLDIGSGYGRLAHRVCTALPGVADYCCVDAVPECTFLSEYYLRYREVTPPARVLELPAFFGAQQPWRFDVAVNVHSFSECTYDAIAGWLSELARLEVEHLFLVPNEPTELLTMEADESRRDFAPLLDRAGYRLVKREPAIRDPAVRELVRIDDNFHLYRLG